MSNNIRTKIEQHFKLLDKNNVIFLPRKFFFLQCCDINILREDGFSEELHNSPVAKAIRKSFFQKNNQNRKSIQQLFFIIHGKHAKSILLTMNSETYVLNIRTKTEKENT